MKTRLEPTRIAPETFLIHDHAGEGTAPVSIALNAMLIRGEQPVVVDTGAVEHREQYLDDLFSLVEPEDVRWVFISHDDVDHTGNLNAVMAACPNATLVIDWFMQERMGKTLEVSPLRWRWMQDGESLDVGDRQLQLVRPPVYDSPTTRGLFDPTTGVYWAADGFATPMPVPVRDVADIDLEVWTAGMATFNQYISPWLLLADERRYQGTVDRIAALQPTAIAGCHTPVIVGDRVAGAIDITRRTPGETVPAQPDQAVLDQIQRTLVEAA
ncbi:MAG TPA: MBL fold metallo-hydrolase [Acidimicrobiales bacterium]|nr:MBL fold metallo-hydrolase [Acidimicrobiales bacterium]